MTNQRWQLLSAHVGERLTPEEIAEGWHFCPDWDFLLIHPDDVEAEGCLCTPNPLLPQLREESK